MVNDAIDDAMDDDEMEDEAEDLIGQVIMQRPDRTGNHATAGYPSNLMTPFCVLRAFDGMDVVGGRDVV